MSTYQEIADRLLARIEGTEFTIGDMLPSIADLQADHAGKQGMPVGVQTVRSAYRILIDAGLVESRQGVGHILVGLPPVTVSQAAGRVLHAARVALLRVAINAGLSPLGLRPHLPDGLESVYEDTLSWLSHELAPQATRSAAAWELRGSVPCYTTRTGCYLLADDGTWRFSPATEDG